MGFAVAEGFGFRERQAFGTAGEFEGVVKRSTFETTDGRTRGFRLRDWIHRSLPSRDAVKSGQWVLGASDSTGLR